MREGLRSGKSREGSRSREGLRSGKLREGLRSGRSRERLQKDEGFSGKVLVQKKLFDMDGKLDGSLNLEDVVVPESTETGPVEDIETEKLDDSVTCSGEVEGVNGCGSHEAVENKQKRRREDGEVCECPGTGTGPVEDIETEKLDDSVTGSGGAEGVNGYGSSEAVKNKKKRRREDGEVCESPGTGKVKITEEVSGGQVQVVGRVLRSRMRSNDEAVEERVEDEPAKVEEKRGLDHNKETNRVKIEEDAESYELVERTSKRNLKRKPRRLPMAGGTAPRGRGRPPLARGTLRVVGNQLHKMRETGNLRKSMRVLKNKGEVKQLRSTRSSKSETILSNDSKPNSPSSCVEAEHVNLPKVEASPVESLDKGDTVSFDNLTKAERIVKHGEDAGITRALEKQLVRDHIVELLFSAGWTIDYRPRQGRDYKDAVYVSPDGKTHWSATLAYRVLKQRYEDGDTRAYREGFIFSPIPKGELDMLKRVQILKRLVKKKHDAPKWRGTPERAAALKKKKKKGKHCSGMSAQKISHHGRMRRKALQYERDDTLDAHGAPQSSGNRKRRVTQNRKRCTLLVRRSDGAESDGDGYVLYNRRRTTFSWMIESGFMLDKTKVSYMNQTKSLAMLHGKITSDGIECGCCNQVVTISDFESHAGSELCQPLENIYAENGKSLLQCQLDAWNKLNLEQKWFHSVDVCGDDPNDDTCGICGDGGKLVCCDGCPSTFHQNCLDIQKFPSGDWYCLYCICKYCGKISEDINHKNVEGVKSSLLSCCLCKEKYHGSCIHADDARKDVQGGLQFCGKQCQELYAKLELLLVVKHGLEDGFSWTLVQRCEVGAEISSSEVSRKIECNSKLAVALLVMDECFLPSFDHRSGINRIHNILYSCGSNFTRLNFSGFYAVTLELGDEIVSVATIRIHGNTLAEMPYIGTRYMYRRQGMCRRLLTAVESVLRSLNVEKLVIPAISELKDTWTSVFGFEPLEASTKRKMRSMNVLVFPGVNMLQKRMVDHQYTGENTVDVEGLVASNGEDRPANEAVVVISSNNICLGKLDENIDSEVTALNGSDEAEGKPSVLKSTSQLLNGSSNASSDITSESIGCPNCPNDNSSPMQLSDEPCDVLDESKSADIHILNTDCDGCKQVKENHAHHRNVGSDCPPLTAETSHPQSGKVNCGLGSLSDSMELDGDYSCELKAASSRSRPLGSHGKDFGELSDGRPPNVLHDSVPLIGSNVQILNTNCDDSKEVEDNHVHVSIPLIGYNGLEPTSQTSEATDRVPKLSADQTVEQISGFESRTAVSPSSTHLIGVPQPTNNCEAGNFDGNVCPAASRPDLNLSLSDEEPAKIITDSIPRIEHGVDDASGDSPPLTSETYRVTKVSADQTVKQISGCGSRTGVCPSSTHLVAVPQPTKNCEAGNFDCNVYPATSRPDLNLSPSDEEPAEIITGSIPRIEHGVDDASGDSPPLTPETSHAQSRGENCGMESLSDPMELDGEPSCGIKAASSPSRPLLGSPGKDSGELSLEHGPPNELLDSVPLVGSDCLEPSSQTSEHLDRVPKVKSDQTFERISGCEPCMGNCVSSAHLTVVPQPTENCEDGKFDCNHSLATPKFDLNLSLCDEEPFITDSIARIENGIDAASGQVIDTDSSPSRDSLSSDATLSDF